MAKIYVGCVVDAAKAKAFADVAKKAMADSMKAAVKKDSALTDTKGEGYVVHLKISDMTVGDTSVSCKIEGYLEGVPKGVLIANTVIKGGAKADGGKPETLVADCVGAVMDDLAPKIIKRIKDKP
jgi:hypothetical protein